jgi:hypothetical protein
MSDAKISIMCDAEQRQPWISLSYPPLFFYGRLFRVKWARPGPDFAFFSFYFF